MANVISYCSKTKAASSMIMSNGLTDVFIDVLALSGSQLAHTDDEKRLIVWLLEKDQSRAGAGTAGFNICEMPWNAETFEDNKKPCLGAIYATIDMHSRSNIFLGG